MNQSYVEKISQNKIHRALQKNKMNSNLSENESEAKQNVHNMCSVNIEGDVHEWIHDDF